MVELANTGEMVPVTAEIIDRAVVAAAQAEVARRHSLLGIPVVIW